MTDRYVMRQAKARLYGMIDGSKRYQIIDTWNDEPIAEVVGMPDGGWLVQPRLELKRRYDPLRKPRTVGAGTRTMAFNKFLEQL